MRETDVPVKNPGSRVIGLETNGDVISSKTSRNDVTFNLNIVQKGQ
jgi:hypothetical protein